MRVCAWVPRPERRRRVLALPREPLLHRRRQRAVVPGQRVNAVSDAPDQCLGLPVRPGHVRDHEQHVPGLSQEQLLLPRHYHSVPSQLDVVPASHLSRRVSVRRGLPEGRHRVRGMPGRRAVPRGGTRARAVRALV